MVGISINHTNVNDMAIKDILDQLKQNEQSTFLEATMEAEKHALNGFFLHYGLKDSDVNFIEYLKILRLIRMINKTTDQKEKGIFSNADMILKTLSFTIIFGSHDKAVAYLERYESKNTDRTLRDLIEKTCAIALPKNKNLIYLWQQLVTKLNPSTPTQIVYIFSKAERIEAYVKKDPHAVKEIIEETITKEHKKRFVQEYLELKPLANNLPLKED